MKHRLELTSSLNIKQGTSEEIAVVGDQVSGILTKEGIFYSAKTVVISAGTFMKGLLHIGETNYSGGRAGDQPSIGLSASLEKLGFNLGRLKTGTPPRVNQRSIDFSLTEKQLGEEGIRFSFDGDENLKRLPQVCLPHHLYDGRDKKNHFRQYPSLPHVFGQNYRDRSSVLSFDRR